ncbi:signal transduction histidine kinase [Arthrobacter sp. CAN_A212]|uniref:GAF domain-containing sensor histidine kinase n=1 Tax=unclassified Arthrobacter TaxID=235627 RepID=UPI0018CA15AF|nr:GAF domain-containing sensor histidine kinase [Arthrobacter sp. CAN_C5]MBP2215229.1 signal transduction histidine kinase [Arthrobacter sp. CAN_C5]
MSPARNAQVADPDDSLPPTGPPAGGIDHLLAGFAAIAENQGLQTVLERVVAAACRLVDAKFAALGVIGPDGALSHFITVGLDEGQISRIGPLPVGHGVLGLLITEPKPLRLEDLRQHPAAFGFPPGHPQMTSFLGVPIRVRDTVFGNLYLTEKNGGGDFSQSDEDLSVALAAAAGVAIENMRLFEAETRRSSWLESGQDAVRTVLNTSPERSLSDVELVAEHAKAASGSSLVLILTRMEPNESLYCEVALGLHSDSLRGRLLGDGSALCKVMPPFGDTAVLNGELLHNVLPATEATAFDAAMSTRISDRGTHARFLVIVRTREDPPFSPVDQRMVAAFASQISTALELTQMQIQREQDAVFGDRDRIARDLHDLVIQRMFAAGLSIQSLRKHVVGEEPLARIASVTTELDATIGELRDTIYSLQSVTHSSDALSSRILALVRRVLDGSEVEPVIHFSGPLDTAVREATATQVEAILRESLSNALQHSQATTITVELTAGEQSVNLRISDNGQGFEQNGRRSGLRNMQHRAEALGGAVTIESSLGHGTTIDVTLPLG